MARETASQFTPKAQQALAFATEIAIRRNTAHPASQDLLLGLYLVAPDLFRRADGSLITEEEVHYAIENNGAPAVPGGDMLLASTTTEIIKDSLDSKIRRKAPQVDAVDLLIACAGSSHYPSAEMMRSIFQESDLLRIQTLIRGEAIRRTISGRQQLINAGFLTLWHWSQQRGSK